MIILELDGRVTYRTCAIPLALADGIEVDAAAVWLVGEI